MADWMWMPFGLVNGVGLHMGVLDFGGDRRRGRGSLGVNLRRPIVTKKDFVDRCVEVCTAIEPSFGMVSGVGPGIHVLDGSPRASRGRGCFWHDFWHFSAFSPYFFQWGNDILINDRVVCEKLTIFPYADYIVEFCVELAFL